MAKRRLPPLNTLRGFDAASRHLSFSLAAQELFITQGAVSRQIRELEEFLGTALFIRATRRVELTDAGKDYFFAIQHIFAELERATNRLNRKRKSKAVTLDILPTLATMWLMPRLEQFSEAHPDVDLRIITSIQPVDFGSDRADIAIRVGRLPGREVHRHEDLGPDPLPVGELGAGLAEQLAAEGADQTGALGDGDELGRPHARRGRVDPAGQRLEPEQAPVGQLHDGLVGQAELAPLDAAPQAELERAALLDLGAHLDVEHLDGHLGVDGAGHGDAGVGDELVDGAAGARFTTYLADVLADLRKTLL